MMNKILWIIAGIAAFVCCVLAGLCIRVACFAESFEEPTLERDETMITISLNARPYFEDSDSEGNLIITNPEHNAYMMEYRYFLTETEELIYQTPLIEPGTEIEFDKLLISLPKGEHEARVDIYAYYPHDLDKPASRYAARIVITMIN